MSTPTPNTGFQTRRTLVWGLCAAVAIGAVVAWNQLKPQGLPSSISSGNGRLEATDIDVATKSGGRIKAILVKEGDDVQQDQVVAIMDTATLDADLFRAQAQTRQAQQARHTVDALLAQLEGRPSPDAADALACAICHAHGSQGLASLAGTSTRKRGGRLTR